jgi:peptidoglycan/LPS O-acetylase OafA/YrhL
LHQEPDVSQSSPAAGGRIAFAHNLRGIAALLVVVAHLAFTFWVNPADTSSHINAPAYAGSGIPALRWLFFHLPVTPSHLGVALFFLISGFVIPFSFQRQRAPSFLVARFFRLWPSYACGLGITVASLWLTACWFGRPYALPVRAVMAHLLMLRDILGQPSLDGIVWTLEIEAKFYLVCALLAFWLRRGRIEPLIAIGLGCLLLTLFTTPVSPTLVNAHPRRYAFLCILQLHTVMIPFMLIGTVFHYHYRGHLSGREAVLLGGLLLACVLGQWPIGVLGDIRQSGIPNYLLALGLFTACYRLRDRLASWRMLERLADMSYPLYVIHAFVGYCYMRIFVSVYDRPVLALGSCLVVVLILAYGIHRLIEAPCNALGKKLAGRLEGWLPWQARRYTSAAPPAAALAERGYESAQAA